MKDKVRELFESYEPSLEYFNFFGGHQFDKTASGDYIDDETQRDWILWQDAIASVVVNLPVAYEFKGHSYFDCENMKEELENSGVRYE